MPGVYSHESLPPHTPKKAPSHQMISHSEAPQPSLTQSPSNSSSTYSQVPSSTVSTPLSVFTSSASSPTSDCNRRPSNRNNTSNPEDDSSISLSPKSPSVEYWNKTHFPSFATKRRVRRRSSLCYSESLDDSDNTVSANGDSHSSNSGQILSDIGNLNNTDTRLSTPASVSTKPPGRQGLRISVSPSPQHSRSSFSNSHFLPSPLSLRHPRLQYQNPKVPQRPQFTLCQSCKAQSINSNPVTPTLATTSHTSSLTSNSPTITSTPVKLSDSTNVIPLVGIGSTELNQTKSQPLLNSSASSFSSLISTPTSPSCSPSSYSATTTTSLSSLPSSLTANSLSFTPLSLSHIDSSHSLRRRRSSSSFSSAALHSAINGNNSLHYNPYPSHYLPHNRSRSRSRSQSQSHLHSHGQYYGHYFSHFHSHKESLVGSYEESLLSGRMSAPSSPPVSFSMKLGVLGQGDDCPSSLKFPKHITTEFNAVFYDYDLHETGLPGKGSPYVGTVDLETFYMKKFVDTGKVTLEEINLKKPEILERRKSSLVSPSYNRNASSNGVHKQNNISSVHASSSSSSLKHNSGKVKKSSSNDKSCNSPLFPFPGYRIPPKGKIQIIISNPQKTAVKLFLIPYDVTCLQVKQKTFIRHKVFVQNSQQTPSSSSCSSSGSGSSSNSDNSNQSSFSGPVENETSINGGNGKNFGGPKSSASSIALQAQTPSLTPSPSGSNSTPGIHVIKPGCLMQAVHLQIARTSKNRYYLYGDLRLVFHNRAELSFASTASPPVATSSSHSLSPNGSSLTRTIPLTEKSTPISSQQNYSNTTSSGVDPTRSPVLGFFRSRDNIQVETMTVGKNALTYNVDDVYIAFAEAESAKNQRIDIPTITSTNTIEGNTFYNNNKTSKFAIPWNTQSFMFQQEALASSDDDDDNDNDNGNFCNDGKGDGVNDIEFKNKDARNRTNSNSSSSSNFIKPLQDGPEIQRCDCCNGPVDQSFPALQDAFSLQSSSSSSIMSTPISTGFEGNLRLNDNENLTQGKNSLSGEKILIGSENNGNVNDIINNNDSTTSTVKSIALSELHDRTAEPSLPTQTQTPFLSSSQQCRLQDQQYPTKNPKVQPFSSIALSKAVSVPDSVNKCDTDAESNHDLNSSNTAAIHADTRENDDNDDNDDNKNITINTNFDSSSGGSITVKKPFTSLQNSNGSISIPLTSSPLSLSITANGNGNGNEDANENSNEKEIGNSVTTDRKDLDKTLLKDIKAVSERSYSQAPGFL